MATKNGTRAYRQRRRAASADMTRERIVDAAREVLASRPLRPLNLSEVADRAGVVRSTVYSVFGSRAGLLRVVVEDTVARGGWERMREAFRQSDALTALARSIEEGTRMAAVEHGVLTAIGTLAAVDPDAATVMAESDVLRLDGMRSLVRRMGEQGYLRPDLDQEEAVDMLYVLTDWQAVEGLYRDRKLDHTALAERLVTMATRALCHPDRLATGAVPARSAHERATAGP